MAIKKIEIQDHQGNIYHPHTDAKVVFTSDGKTVEEGIESLKSNVNNGKTVLATTIGTPIASTDTFAQMGSKIDTLTNTFKNKLTGVGVDVIPSDKMSNLINKIDSMKKLPSWFQYSLHMNDNYFFSGRVGVRYISKDNYAYACCGSKYNDGSTNLYACSDVDRFNIITNTSEKIANFKNNRSGNLTEMLGDNIHVLCGTISNSPTTTHESLNVITNTISDKASCPLNYYNTTKSCSDGSNIYIFGGYYDSYGYGTSQSYIYNSITNTWKKIADAPSSSLSSFVFDGKVYCGHGTIIKEYSPSLNTYTNIEYVPSFYPSGFFSCDGNVYNLGVDKVHKFNPITKIEELVFDFNHLRGSSTVLYSSFVCSNILFVQRRDSSTRLPSYHGICVAK